MAGFPQILIGWLVGDIFDLDGTLFTWPDGEIVISAPDFGTSNILCAEFGLSQAGTVQYGVEIIAAERHGLGTDIGQDDFSADIVDRYVGTGTPESAGTKYAILCHDAANCALDQSLIDSFIGGRAGRQGSGSGHDAQTSQEYSAGKHLRHSSYLRAGGTRPVLTR